MERYRLILLGDSCSGIPGHVHESNFAAVRDALLRRPDLPATVCYLGDHVSGYVDSARELDLQWRYFLQQEFLSLEQRFARVFHIPGNHDVYDSTSLERYQAIFGRPASGNVVAQRQLNHAVRDAAALLVFLNTADPGHHGRATLDVGFLDDVLERHRDAPLKLVFGHHPILPVNGYSEWPMWTVPPAMGERAWAAMRRHGVAAYICSHIIAFDFQVRQGVAQLCSGGAGTEYGPGGAMPGETEYRHFVECEFYGGRIVYRVIDQGGRIREQLAWPPDSVSPVERLMLRADAPTYSRYLGGSEGGPASGYVMTWAIRGRLPDDGWEAPLVMARMADGAPPVFRIDRGRACRRLFVRMASAGGAGEAVWAGPEIARGGDIDLEIALHSGGGPGEILARHGGDGWSSLEAASGHNLPRRDWPILWQTGAPPSPLTVEMAVRRQAP